ncbi:MAG: hypothetical protein QF368_19490, partial [SAR202 cluster bacterium]|nr:hypothetical protein [SAR202 cluster bacterium]
MRRMKGPLHRWVLIFAFVSLAAAPLTLLWSDGLGATPVSATQGGPSCSGDSHVVVKPVDGIDDDYLNAKYGTETVRKFYGTDIYVLEAPNKKGAKRIVRKMLKSDDVVWAE